jgi:transcriptional regulator with XRE-family HTH domain
MPVGQSEGAAGYIGDAGIRALALKANVSDRTIITLENGGSIAPPEVAQRIADALGVSLVTLGRAAL